MDQDQKKARNRGLICLIVGCFVLIASSNECGMQHQESIDMDKHFNRELELRNGWSPGAADKRYPPGTTWRYVGGPSFLPFFGVVAGVALMFGGVGLLLLGSAAAKPKESSDDQGEP